MSRGEWYFMSQTCKLFVSCTVSKRMLHPVACRSLLDILKETIASEGRETMIARVLYVGQLPDKHSRTR